MAFPNMCYFVRLKGVERGMERDRARLINTVLFRPDHLTQLFNIEIAFEFLLNTAIFFQFLKDRLNGKEEEENRGYFWSTFNSSAYNG